MNRRCLAVVNSDMIVVPMHSTRNSRLGFLLGQTQDCIKVLLLLRFFQLPPRENAYVSQSSRYTCRIQLSHHSSLFGGLMHVVEGETAGRAAADDNSAKTSPHMRLEECMADDDPRQFTSDSGEWNMAIVKHED
jgi:hypothetical protein